MQHVDNQSAPPRKQVLPVRESLNHTQSATLHPKSSNEILFHTKSLSCHWTCSLRGASTCICKLSKTAYQLGLDLVHGLLAQVMQNLIACGAISFAVRIDCSTFDRYTFAHYLNLHAQSSNHRSHNNRLFMLS